MTEGLKTYADLFDAILSRTDLVIKGIGGGRSLCVGQYEIRLVNSRSIDLLINIGLGKANIICSTDDGSMVSDFRNTVARIQDAADLKKKFDIHRIVCGHLEDLKKIDEG